MRWALSSEGGIIGEGEKKKSEREPMQSRSEDTEKYRATRKGGSCANLADPNLDKADQSVVTKFIRKLNNREIYTVNSMSTEAFFILYLSDGKNAGKLSDYRSVIESRDMEKILNMVVDVQFVPNDMGKPYPTHYFHVQKSAREVVNMRTSVKRKKQPLAFKSASGIPNDVNSELKRMASVLSMMMGDGQLVCMAYEAVMVSKNSYALRMKNVTGEYYVWSRVTDSIWGVVSKMVTVLNDKVIDIEWDFSDWKNRRIDITFDSLWMHETTVGAPGEFGKSKHLK